MIKNFDRTAVMTNSRDISYTEFIDYVALFAKHTPREGAKTVVFSENREGWLFAFFAIWENKGLAVPVDASSTVADVAYILRDCQPACIWTSSERRAVAEEAIAETGLDIEVLLIDDYESAVCEHVEKKDEEAVDRFSLDNHDAAVIIYTSGTTGSPKGVVLSYANIYANMLSVTKDVHIFDGIRRTLILLPLHHVLPLVGTVVLPIISGGGVAICPSMSGPDIMNTLCRGKIGIFVGVPRLWQTLYNGIKKKIDASAVTRALFWLCAKINSRKLSRFVFKTVHKKLGGHIAYCVSGGAALDTEIGEGLRTLGIPMLEGYGMTETAPIISFTRPGDIIPGCVGLPMSTVEVKIVNDEICVKGPNVMLGYYNRPEETAQVIDEDGYVHTGDLGYLDEQGRIHITGRSKEIIVLSNGKNVQPNEIEYKLEKYDSMVKEVAVTQDGDMLRAIIVPQEEWARQLSDAEVEEALKRMVIEPYNGTVTNYKKIMSLFVYRGELPRTKLDKLQRFKLKAIIENGKQADSQPEEVIEEVDLEEYRLLRDYIEGGKKLRVKPTDHLETDLAFDSLDKVELQGFIEQTFGVEIKTDAFAAYHDIREIAEFIAKSKTRMKMETVDWHSIMIENSSNLQMPSTSCMFAAHIKMFKWFFRLHNRLEIKGKENIPASGPFILAPNHQSYVDGPVCVSGLNRKTLRSSYFYATEDHVKSAFRRYMARHNNVIIMERHNLKDSILKLAEVLKQGKNIVIFPEGTRTHDGSVMEFKKTFAILSCELKVPVLPVRISGAFEALPRGKHFPGWNKITVEYLAPVTPAEGESYEALSDKVRDAILH